MKYLIATLFITASAVLGFAGVLYRLPIVVKFVWLVGLILSVVVTTKEN